MSSVEVDPTLSMVADQAVTAAASAIAAAAGVDASLSGASPARPADVTDGVDVAFRVRFGSSEAAIVYSETLAAALAGGDAAADAAAVWDALTTLTDVGSRAVAERLRAVVDGVGDPAPAEPLAEGIGNLHAGDARRVDVEIAGTPAGWLMWIGSPDLVDGLVPRGGSPAAVIDAIDYPDLGEGAAPAPQAADISFLSDVTMGVTVELGRTVMRVREVLQLTQGSVIELDRAAGALVDVLISGSLVARGEVVVMDDQLGVRVVEIIDSANPGR